MTLDGIRAISFDASGTLIAPEPSVGIVYARALAELGFDVDPDTLDERFFATFRALKKADPAAPLSQERWRAIVRGTLDGLTPADRFEECFGTLWRVFAEPTSWRVLPGAAETLTCLMMEGYRLIVLSNNDERLPGLLDGLGLGGFFEAVIVSAEVGADKPDARVFRHAEERLDLPASALLHVGDSWREDVRGPTDHGWRALWLNEGAPPETLPPGAAQLPDLPAFFACFT